MDRRTKVIVALLFLALLAVASGLWRRFQPAPAPASTQVKADGYRILTSGMVEAADEHRAVIAEAMQVPNEVEAAEEKGAEAVVDDIDVEDDDTADDAFLEEEEEDDDDVSSLIDGEIAPDEEP